MLYYLCILCWQNGDTKNTVDVKPRINEELGEKSKSWKLAEINEPSKCRSLRLMDNMRTSKVNALLLQYRFYYLLVAIPFAVLLCFPTEHHISGSL